MTLSLVFDQEVKAIQEASSPATSGGFIFKGLLTVSLEWKRSSDRELEGQENPGKEG